MVAALKALWKAVLGLLRQSSPVPLDVTGAVYRDVDVDRAVRWAVYWAVFSAVKGVIDEDVWWAGAGAVSGAVDWSVWMAVEEAMVSAMYGDGTVHPALEDFLRSVDE